jgi:hypothetical protein
MTAEDDFRAEPATAGQGRAGVDHELAMISRQITRRARRVARAGEAPEAVKPQRLLLSCMKNEGATVLEWVAYHRVIGFDHFLIYTNDCEDGTDLIWKRLDQMGLASFQDNPPKRPVARHKPQVRGLIRAMTHPAYTSAEWVMMLDADEYLNIHAGDGRLSDLLAQNADADCFMINWRLFGSSGVQDFQPGFVTEQFLHGADPERVSRSHALAPKSIFRPDRFSKPNIHRPANPVDGGERIYATASGQPIPRSWGAVSRHGGYSHAQINHYSVQSMDMLLLKFARGFAVERQMESPQEYLEARDFNHCRDESILRHQAQMRSEYDRLIADPVLARLQAAAVEWRQKKLAEALAQPELHAMKAALVAAQAALGSDVQDADAA